MRHIAGYLLCVLGGNASPSADDVSKLLKAGGVDADAAALKTLCANLSGKVS
jgi:large subunit ribosomal protein LP2